ncbi:HAUS augmin-like complex subunit 4 [Hemiscyllium ocellatum]|uniref:HAUS augmin-like complex subunit 4 n=1 Tax=Hemiscyllium ocellatum TaxID=170820 RepID=UPI0029665FE7|nr:HAUS augmin-like complex subunit 4 [Hemiscyllium ocellatum]
MAKCGALPQLLEADRQKQERERERAWENRVTITKQTIAYLTVLHHCLVLLRELIERHRLGSQPELDAELLAYLRLKTKAMFTKLGLMKLELRHQLFNKDTVQAHTAIRALLQEELEVQESSAETLRGTLGLYQMLGEDFEGLVAEYSHLLELLGNKRWALQEFTKSQN